MADDAKPKIGIGSQFLRALLGPAVLLPEALKTAISLSPIAEIPKAIQPAVNLSPIAEVPEALTTALPIIGETPPISALPEALQVTPLPTALQLLRASESGRAKLATGQAPPQAGAEALTEFLTGQKPQEFGDILREMGVTGTPAAVGGLTLDIATDPLTYGLGFLFKNLEKAATTAKFLNPETIETAIKTKPHGIISASLSTLTPEENIARTAQLAEDIKNLGHTPIPAKGVYKNVAGETVREPSFLVPNLTEEEALQLGKKYGQESIVTNKGGYFTEGGFAPKTGETQFGQFPENFTEVQVGNKVINFQHPINFDEKLPLPLNLLDTIKRGIPNVVKETQQYIKNPNEWWDNLEAGSEGIQKEIIQAIRGKGELADIPDTLAQVIRNIRGDQEFSVARAGNIANLLTRQLRKVPNLLNSADAALKGDLAALNQLPKTTQNVVYYMRKIIDRYSGNLTDELERIAGTMTEEQLDRLASIYGVQEGRRISLPNLIQVIKQNQGQYVRRMYEIFTNKNYKPKPEDISKAVQGLVADYEISEARATSLIKGLIENKTIEIPFGRASLKIKQGSFIARQNIPEYIRNVMGEIKDPRYNFVQTVRNLAESSKNFELFRTLKEQRYLSDIRTDTLTKQLPNEGTLAWGLANGQFTSPEIYDLLTHTSKIQNAADDKLLKSMMGLKFLKTVLNPKTHGHNIFGNVFFGILDDWLVPWGQSLKYFKYAQKEFNKGLKSQFIQDAIKDTVIGSEFPSSASRELKLNYFDDVISHPYGDRRKFLSIPHTESVNNFLRSFGQEAMKVYGWEDQIFKLAAYKRALDSGLSRPEATAKVFKSWTNYAEAAHLAQTARSTGAGQLLGNPFMTFRVEAHRIMLEAIKDPTKRLRLAMLLGSVGIANAAILAVAGKGIEEIYETFQTRPEALAETIFNPLSPNYDLNTRYSNPFNPRGLFAPLLALSGATGVNPADYILDFTQLSPEFGYSNLLIGAIEGLITGKGRYGEDLSTAGRIESLIQGLAPTSIGRDLPKILSPDEEPTERIRRSLRFLGIDVEQRNPNYIRGKVRQRLEEKVRAGQPIENTMSALESLGFDSQKILGNVQKKIVREEKAKKREALKGSQNAYKK